MQLENIPSIVGFLECDTCRAKPGSAILCTGCLHNRYLIEKLNNKDGQPSTTKEFISKNFGRAIAKLGEAPTTSWEEDAIWHANQILETCFDPDSSEAIVARQFFRLVERCATERAKAVEEHTALVRSEIKLFSDCAHNKIKDILEKLADTIPSLTESKLLSPYRDALGKYDYSDMSLLCICGHRLGVHSAERSAPGERPCWNGDDAEDCSCKNFSLTETK